MKSVNYVKRGILCIILLVLFSSFVFAPPLGFERESAEQERLTLRENIQHQIDTSLRQGSTLDLSQPLFRENADEVRFVLLEKYNVDINSIIGGRIHNGKLELPGGSSFDLKTGNLLSINAAGATINSFSDGEMVVVNAVGVQYDGENLRVERGEKVKYNGAESNNIRNFVGEPQIMSIISADMIVKEGNVLNKVKAVDMRTTGASSLFNFVCAENRHQTIVGVQLACKPNKRIRADISPREKKFVLEKDITFKYENVEGSADADDAVIAIKQIEQNIEEILTTLTTIKITASGFVQTIISKTETRFKRDKNEGIYELSLGAESRFSSQDGQDETRSFFVLNTNTQPYTLFINTPSHQLSRDAALALYSGFADPTLGLFAFTGIISFGGYDVSVPYDFFESESAANSIVLNNAHLAFSTRCDENKIVFALHNGAYDLLEVCNDGQQERYADAGEQDTPLRVTSYTPDDAEISFNSGLQQKKNGKFFALYAENEYAAFRASLQDYEQSFAMCSSYELFLAETRTLSGVFG